MFSGFKLWRNRYLFIYKFSKRNSYPGSKRGGFGVIGGTSSSQTTKHQQLLRTPSNINERPLDIIATLSGLRVRERLEQARRQVYAAPTMTARALSIPVVRPPNCRASRGLTHCIGDRSGCMFPISLNRDIAEAVGTIVPHLPITHISVCLQTYNWSKLLPQSPAQRRTRNRRSGIHTYHRESSTLALTGSVIRKHDWNLRSRPCGIVRC